MASSTTVFRARASREQQRGGGLATLGGGLCINPEGVTSSAANLVAAGNTIAAPSGTGTGSGVEGAGVTSAAASWAAPTT